ncbi:hypothetical protein L345_10191, partial [Ophiophagus hannah]
MARLGEKSRVDKPANLKEKKEAIPGIYGTTLPINTFAHQELHIYGLETDCSAEKKFHSPEGTLTSTIYKLNSNSNKQGHFYSWSHIPNQGNTSVSRDFSKPDAELPSGSSDGLTNLATTNLAVHCFTKRYHPVSYPETKKTALEKNCRKDDGDSLKKTNEVTSSDSYLATDSSSDDIHAANKWKSKKRNVNTESKRLVEEKEVTESEKRNRALLEYFKHLNVNIKTDPFVDQEDAPSLLENDKFPYPDFLPSPYNNLDLKKLSLSKSDSWKSSINPPLNDSLDKIVSRLVEMERLQHLTVLREKKREAVSAVAAASNRSISTKELHQSKQPRPLDCLCCLFRPERDIKCSCQNCHSHKNSTSIRSSSKPSKRWESQARSAGEVGTDATGNAVGKMVYLLYKTCREFCYRVTDSRSLPLNLSSILLLLRRLRPPRDLDRLLKRDLLRLPLSLKMDLTKYLIYLLRGDLLLLLGDRLRRSGERDLRRIGDLDLLLEGDHLGGLASFDRSLLERMSSLVRVLEALCSDANTKIINMHDSLEEHYLGEEKRLLSDSLLFLSADLLFALLTGDRFRDGDLLCLDLRSLSRGDLLRLSLSRGFGDKLLPLGLRPGLLLGDLFSLPDDISFEVRHSLWESTICVKPS